MISLTEARQWLLSDPCSRFFWFRLRSWQRLYNKRSQMTRVWNTNATLINVNRCIIKGDNANKIHKFSKWIISIQMFKKQTFFLVSLACIHWEMRKWKWFVWIYKVNSHHTRSWSLKNVCSYLITLLVHVGGCQVTTIYLFRWCITPSNGMWSLHLENGMVW